VHTSGSEVERRKKKKRQRIEIKGRIQELSKKGATNVSCESSFLSTRDRGGSRIGYPEEQDERAEQKARKDGGDRRWDCEEGGGRWWRGPSSVPQGAPSQQ